MGTSGRARDGYVQISEHELSELSLEHLASGVDPSIAVPRDVAVDPAEVVTGYSEWQGAFRGTPVTLGWDWALYGGLMRVLDSAEIRTNIRLVAEDGSARAPETSRWHLALWIESLPWRALARGVIAGQR